MLCNNCIQKMITLRLRRFLLGLTLLLLAMPNLSATHIIGGEMNYTCLGNNQYEISLTVYRDCFLGEALMDDTAYVAIYDPIGILITTIPMLLGNVDTVFQIEDCLLAPENICVETTVYKDIVELAPISGGYHISYQRCCRNATILNIRDPLNTGATYDIILTEAAMAACNASPKIKAWPPTFICVNRPLNFNHSASDREGDSLVYKLCTPFEGGISLINPRPRPAVAPPYDTIVWVAPTYSLENLLGGTPLKIDAQTGILTGTPATIGQFVVGVCVEEYRNGQLLSETRRDFQYNVIPCQDITADFSIPEKQCDDLTLTVENKSLGGTNYLWKFLQEDSLIGTSTTQNPSFVFLQTGEYTVRLIIEPNTSCIDSIEKNITLFSNTVSVDFSNELIGCEDSLFLQLNDRSISEQDMIISRLWTLTSPITQFSSTEIAPRFNIKQSQIFTVSLEVFTENGCSVILQKEIETVVISGAIAVSTPDTIFTCEQVPIALNPSADPNLNYMWGPSEGLDAPNSANPQATITTSTSYTVTVSDAANNCFFERSIHVEIVKIENDFDFGIQYLSCTEDLVIEIIPDAIKDVHTLYWTLNNGIDTIYSDADQSIFDVVANSNSSITGRIENELGCIIELTKAIDTRPIPAPNLVDTVTICKGEAIQLSAAPALANYQYAWFPNEAINDPNSATPIVNPIETTTYTLLLKDTLRQCYIEDSTTVVVLEAVQDFEAPPSYNCMDNLVTFTPNQLGTLSWDFGDNTPILRTTNESSINHIYEAEGDYVVQVTTSNQGLCSNVIMIPVTVENKNIVPAFDWDTKSCTTDGIELLLEDKSIINNGQITAWDWTLSNGATSMEQNPTFFIKDLDSLIVRLSIVIDNNSECSYSIEELIKYQQPIFPDLPNILSACYQTDFAINENPDTNFIYEWFPRNLINSNSPNPIVNLSDTSEISVNLIDKNGCTQTQQIIINVPPPIEINTTPIVSICEAGLPTEISAYSPQASQQFWLNEIGDTIGFEAELPITVEQSSQFTSVIIDKFGCLQQQVVTVQLAPISLEYNNRHTLCIGDTLELVLESMQTMQEIVYNWESNTSIIGDRNTSTLSVYPEVTTSYIFTAINQSGCEIRDTILVEVLQNKPIVNISAASTSIINGDAIELQATQNPNFTYSWFPNNTLSNLTIYNPIATPTEDTNYELLVIDENGCSATAAIQIQVQTAICNTPYIFVPSAFTPNNDGENDILYVRGDIIERLEFIIYDRWGQKIFESTNQNIGWEGTNKGKKMPSGVFGYYLYARCLGGEDYYKQGNVTLIR